MILKCFCRIMDIYPAPVVPIFTDDEDKLEYFQIFDDSRKISEFEGVTISDRDRLIFDASSAITSRSPGNSALYGLAIDSNHVIVGTYATIRANIAKQISDIKPKDSPFSLLDIAMFLEDEDLILSAASACQSKLDTISPSLSSKWLIGSPLSADVKERLHAISAPLSDRGEDPNHYRFGFTGPWVAMGAITSYCSHQFGYRSQLIRSYFEDESRYDEIIASTSNVDDCLRILLDLQSRNFRIGGFNAMSPSRGSVYIWLKDIEKFYGIRNLFREKMRRSEFYKDYRSTSMYSSGTEHLSFIMVMCIMLQNPPFASGLMDIKIESNAVHYSFKI